MTNPKVFEFAKEVGMTPLALMDKIREWHLPIKSHMSEIDPESLAQIKAKLSGADNKAAEEAAPKAKKAVAKKPAVAKTAPKKAAAPVETPVVNTAAPVVAGKPVIRRKAAGNEDLEPGKARIISKPQTPEVEPVVEVAPEPKVETPKVVIQRPEKPRALVKEEAPPAPVEAKIEEVKPVVEAKVATTESSKAPPSRKKEVVVGTSGVASSNVPAQTGPRRNIVGRMDLSRVQAPPGASRPQGGGYQSGGSRPAGAPQAGGAAPKTTGRHIRAGFVAASAPEEVFENQDDTKEKRDFEKKAKRLNSGTMNAKEKDREEEAADFNAVEFRKREMVFQPKKKKGSLARESMKTQITTPKASKRVVKVYGSMKVGDVAQEMGLKASQLMKVLVTNGVMASMNTDLDFDTIALIAPEFGWEAQNVQKSAEEIVVETAFGEVDAELITRPPVVTVMGHVDHGKTSLLDAIRSANVAKGEAGGITQHIGAYSVTLEDKSQITFLDTPGHEAFTQMRARGANATDIAIIVVAADDGMMPQTAEAVNHAKAAGVPIIVAVNKIDKPGANVDRIKQQLTEFEIVPEEWGGTTIFCEVSALKRTGIKELLENIKLVAEVQELKANPKRSGTGIVIESKLEKGKGTVATLLVKDGTVKVGQYIVAGTKRGKIKSLTNDKGERLQEVGPGFPAEVLGLSDTPAAGDRFDIVKDEATAEKVAEVRAEQEAKAANNPSSKMSLEDIFSKVTQGDLKELAIILKADVHGSLEAVTGMINKLSTSEVKARIIHSAVGGITESDVLLANTAKGIIIGFNVRPDNGAQTQAKRLGVDIRTYSIVYELVDQLKLAMGGLLAPDIVEKVMGAAEVRNTFTVPKIGMIAGCFITSGKVNRSNMARLIRDGKIIYEGKIGSLKRFKDDAKEVAEGFECGIGIENFNDIKVGDIIEAYVREEKIRSLDGGAPAEA